MARKLLVGVIAWFAFVSVACGTVDANVHVTFTENGKASANVSMKATGALGNVLAGAERKDNDAIFLDQRGQRVRMDENDWQLSKTAEDDATVVTMATKRPLDPDEPPLLKTQDEFGLFDEVNWTTGGNIFVRRYQVRLVIASSGDLDTSALGEAGQLVDQKTLARMLDALFKVRFSVTMPGQITETDADSHTGEKGTWLSNYSSLTKGKTLRAESKQIVWPAIGAAALGLAGVLGTGAWVVLRRRRAL